MNNEEKILAMLATLTEDVSGIKEKLEEVDQRSMHTQSMLEEVDQRSMRTQVLLETDVSDKLQLLYEGHQTLLDTLAPKDRVEKLEEDAALLKSTLRLLSQDVANLKKAQ